MKILVFDDNAIHRDAAKAQLKGHDVTIVATYDEALKLLRPQLSYDRAKEIFAAKYGDKDPYMSDGVTDKVRNERMKFYEEAEKQATTYPDFEVVLTDLLVPASNAEQGYNEFVGKEMPVGVFIGLFAAAKGGAKYVAVFTDSSHHDHPASACFDAFNGGEACPTPFIVNGCKVLFSNTRAWVKEFKPNDLAKPLDIYADLPPDVSPAQRLREWTKAGKVVRAKNWKAVLDYLLK